MNLIDRYMAYRKCFSYVLTDRQISEAVNSVKSICNVDRFNAKSIYIHEDSKSKVFVLCFDDLNLDTHRIIVGADYVDIVYTFYGKIYYIFSVSLNDIRVGQRGRIQNNLIKTVVHEFNKFYF